MRGFIALAAVAGALCVGTGIATASNGSAVVGGGKTSTDIFSINAHSGVPLGGPATGHLKAKENPIFRPSTFDIRGNVTCLRILGNSAVVGGLLTEDLANGVPFLPGRHGFLFYVTDNGNHKGLTDAISYEFIIPNSPGPTCPAPNPALATFPLTQGNINVVP